MSRRFYTLDVFTDTKLAGNPLAVVLDAEGLDAKRMQAITREFNLSETVFVLPPEAPGHAARLRIFTPGQELPFAGHPTVGTAVLLAKLHGQQDSADLILGETVGPVEAHIEDIASDAPKATFTLPRLPEQAGEAPGLAAVAAAIGLDPDDLGFDAHQVGVFAAGVTFTCIPVKSLTLIGRARVVAGEWDAGIAGLGHKAAYLYTREVKRLGSAFHARMFSPAFGIGEDPATGAAAAAFAGALMQYEYLPDGTHVLQLEQGFEMGRPSLITLTMEVQNQALVKASIAGRATIVSEGTLHL
ncbi:PhzF family phenazine biosynthesis protein [Methylovirgula sp. 4M-Z18]|uniref:PhzF family phenazine biosynthesis protein n=1 Tax=Methylovirgula sp. 4M-Z18 TaxID=2293567 RepID=UPI000E2F6F3E|nr:PhzF family phenazine biosynthesis protein [Methylovirgula sp. 4M-Z18]RFB75040.1 PhzF family phenazine biosynthesis protein [Methylovirgula sp. 4M-Z18]